jgi:hypothetical protein
LRQQLLRQLNWIIGVGHSTSTVQHQLQEATNGFRNVLIEFNTLLRHL